MLTWNELFKNEFNKQYFKELMKTLEEEEKIYQIFPKKTEIFTAFQLNELNNVKCVILGQDPYSGINQANGLAFSVNQGIKLPPSLKNIFRELNSDLGIRIPLNGDLTKWAREGVLLLNNCLTVRENCPNSHKDIGWEIFTNKIIEVLNQELNSISFILWGNNAKKKLDLITNNHHQILQGSHPSPLSCYNGFFGGKYFSRTNEFLIKTGRTPIDWNLN